ncbi:hypothetical protein AVEN_22560-1 [Araneus ventricosus]|uniref:Uncharacterized protein n=1 Tax=Araneus ventricosus TaxID=182803 RepID=A0A4Y2E5P0_ARAVE|nr:hypothetical protein AVEN_22560-1 [Araneus ventricosus]
MKIKLFSPHRGGWNHVYTPSCLVFKSTAPVRAMPVSFKSHPPHACGASLSPLVLTHAIHISSKMEFSEHGKVKEIVKVEILRNLEQMIRNDGIQRTQNLRLHAPIPISDHNARLAAYQRSA